MFAAIINGQFSFGVTPDIIKTHFKAGRCRAVCRYPQEGRNNAPSLALLQTGETDWDLRGQTYQMAEATWTRPIASLAEAMRLARIDL